MGQVFLSSWLETTEMKTRNGSWMSLLCSEGRGPGRSRAPCYSPESLSSGWMTPNRKRGCPLAGTLTPCQGRGTGEEGKRSITWTTCLPHSSHSSQQPRLPLSTDWATGPPATVPTSPGVPLDNIARFLSLRLFSFSIENAKYLKGIGEVSNLKEIIY